MLMQCLEHAANFYGQPILLLHKWIPRHQYEVMIFNIGGLLFWLNSEEPVFYAVDPSWSLDQLVEAINAGNFPREEVEFDSPEACWEVWFYSARNYECEVQGRNRCLDLFRRGGRVNPRFLESSRK